MGHLFTLQPFEVSQGSRIALAMKLRKGCLHCARDTALKAITKTALEKTLMLGKTEGKRRRGQQRTRWLDSVTDSLYLNLSKHQEMVEDRGTWHAPVHGVTKSCIWLSDWKTTLKVDPKHAHRKTYLIRNIWMKCFSWEAFSSKNKFST